VVAPNANSRFFTDCYHRPPQSRQGLGGRRHPAPSAPFAGWGVRRGRAHHQRPGRRKWTL